MENIRSFNERCLFNAVTELFTRQYDVISGKIPGDKYTVSFKDQYYSNTQVVVKITFSHESDFINFWTVSLVGFFDEPRDIISFIEASKDHYDVFNMIKDSLKTFITI